MKTKTKYVVRLLVPLLLFGTLSCGNLKVRQAIEGGIQAYSGLSQALDDLEKEDELTIGRAVSKRILGRTPMAEKEWANRYVNMVGKLVASHRFKRDGRLDIFHFSVIDKTTLNAYSTPGGYVFVTKGLLNACQNESQLAAVLAHEIAHVQHAHVLNAIESNRRKGGFSQALSGAANMGTAMADMDNGSKAAVNFLANSSDFAANLLFNEGFSPEQELETDKLAVKLTAKAGYDPTSLVSVLKTLQKKKENPTNQQTHPATDKRVRTIQQYINSENLTGDVTLKERFQQTLNVEG